ncbi:MAG TPA: hypothetical protein VLV87_02470 [Gammaproteobacteria bacterium]|nr:hypothetical protein [Gammaproteobacteria bacterium]
MQQQLPTRPGLLGRVISAVILLMVFAAAFAVGAVLFLVVLGLVVVLGIAFYLRLRWLRHQWRQRAPSARRHEGHVLEGEYTVKDQRPPTRH